MGLPTTPKLGEEVPGANTEPVAAPIPAGKEGE